MKMSHVLAAVLLTGTMIGSAVALTRDDGLRARGADGDAVAQAEAPNGACLRVADGRRDRRDHHRRDRHRHHDDDDRDDDRDGHGAGRAGRAPAAGPVDPATPVPDNGLFQGRARPKVEVN